MNSNQQAPHFVLHDVSRHWGEVIALETISLSLKPGECVAVVGPSGGGKSTLLNLLGGSLRTTTGQIQIDGKDVHTLSRGELRQHRSRCGRIEQGNLVLPQLSVHNNVIAGLLPHWPWWRIAWSTLWPTESQAVQELLKQVGLETRQWERASILSGGQQQRVAVLRALIGKPSVLLADEPTASLDPSTSQSVAELLFSHAKKNRATLVWCTHWISLIQSQVDRIIGIQQGKIVIDAPANTVSQEDMQALYQNSHERLR